MLKNKLCKDDKKKRYKTKYSSGVLGFRINEKNDIEYLMVKRRFTYSFFDFLMGNYKLADISYIGKMITRMTKQEKFFLFTKDNFNELWKLIWKNDSFFKTNYYCGLVKFTILKRGYMIDGNYINLEILLTRNKTTFSNCEWGFPKGKKEPGEDEFISAVREFEEETGIKNYSIIDMPNIYENHRAINGIVYKTFLYFAYIHDNNIVNIENCDTSEIADIKWFSKNDLTEKIRFYQNSIIKSIELAEDNIKKRSLLKENIQDMVNITLNEKKNLYSNLISHGRINTDYTSNYEVQYIFDDYRLMKKDVDYLLSRGLNYIEEYISSLITSFMNIKLKFKKRQLLHFCINVNNIHIKPKRTYLSASLQSTPNKSPEKQTLSYDNIRLLFEDDDESDLEDLVMLDIDEPVIKEESEEESKEEKEYIEDYTGFCMLFKDDEEY